MKSFLPFFRVAAAAAADAALPDKTALHCCPRRGQFSMDHESLTGVGPAVSLSPLPIILCTNDAGLPLSLSLSLLDTHTHTHTHTHP